MKFSWIDCGSAVPHLSASKTSWYLTGQSPKETTLNLPCPIVASIEFMSYCQTQITDVNLANSAKSKDCFFDNQSITYLFKSLSEVDSFLFDKILGDQRLTGRCTVNIETRIVNGVIESSTLKS